jgi:hypothetical protein
MLQQFVELVLMESRIDAMDGITRYRDVAI